MLPFQMIAGGNFTLTSITQPVDLQLVSQNPPDYIYMRNRSAWGLVTAATQSVDYWWKRGMAQGTAQGLTQTITSMAISSTLSTAAGIASDGISYYDTSNPPTFAGLASTALTANAGTFVLTMANTGSIAVGDYVRLVNVVNAQQISGYRFQVTAVTANVSVTLGYMASSGITFAADGTTSTVIKVIPNRMYPRRRYIANITRAAQATVFFTEQHDFTPGERVAFRLTSAFGMSQISNVEARVLSVTNSATVSSIVIDLDTSGFTAFTFPTSANTVLGNSSVPAVCLPPASSVVPFNGSATVAQQPPGTNLLDSFDDRNTRLIHLGASMFANATIGNVWDWYALKYDQFNQQ